MLIFDGDCGFCTQCANWIRKRLPEHFRVVAWQDVELSVLGLSEAEVSTAVYWIDDAGQHHRGSVGVARCLTAMGKPWSMLGMALRVPPVSWVARGGYRLVANNRHRLPGATDACRIGH